MSKLIRDDMMPFITKEEISQLTKSIASQITDDFHGEEVVLISPLNGSFMFTSDLAREIKVQCQIDFVKARSLGKSYRMIQDISTDIYGKNVIIVEEVIDEGKTLMFLRNHLLASKPKSLMISCLIDKPSRRETPIIPDYVGKTIGDRYIIGYGMDSDGIGRNYSNIYSFFM